MGIKDRISNLFSSTSLNLSHKQAPVVMYSNISTTTHRRDKYDTYAEEGYKQNAIVYRCVNEIAQGAAAVGFKAYDGDVELIQHPILNLLARPNPLKYGVEYFQSLYSSLLISGNSYALRVGPEGGPPQELHLLRADRVKISASQTEIPDAYEYILGGRVVTKYPVDKETGSSEVKHFKFYNPLDDFYGLSPLYAAATDVDQHNMSAKHNVSLLQNGARPSGAIVFKPKDESGMTVQLSESQRQQLMSDLEARFTGSHNAGRQMLLEGDFEWKEMGLSPKDMDFLQLKNMAARDIALCFGVPSQLVGVPDSATYSNMAEARLALYEETIIPLLKRTESDLNEWLSPLFGDTISVRYDIESIPAIAERRKKIYESVVQGVEAGIMTRNEARERLGLEPIDGGDDIYIAANLFPLGSATVSPIDQAAKSEDYPDPYENLPMSQEREDTYPDGTAIDDNLPNTYHESTIKVACINCGNYDQATKYCHEYDAKARDNYLCDDYESNKDLHKAIADVDTVPTDAMAEEAKKGLAWRKEFNRGGTSIGVARANQLINKERLSPDTVRRMKSFFARHAVDAQAEGFRQGEEGYPSAGRIAHALWGGDAGKSWSYRKVDELNGEEKAMASQFAVGDSVSWNTSGFSTYGKILRIIRQGELDVPNSSFRITGSLLNPAALIRVYKKVGSEFIRTETIVGHRFSALTKINDM